jgi:hypothetical protein
MMLADFHFPARLRPALAQAARVLCPEELETLGLVDHVVDYVELQLRAFPRALRVGMVAGLQTLETSAALRPARLGVPFSRLPLDEARAWFRGFWESPVGPLRQLAKALKALVSLAYYDSAPLRERLSYHPDAWIAERARRRLEVFGADIRRHEDALRAPDPLLPAGRLARKVRHA